MTPDLLLDAIYAGWLIGALIIVCAFAVINAGKRYYRNRKAR